MLLRYLEKYADSDKVAVYSEKEKLTYKELWQRTEAVAWFLKENYNTDKPVAIYGDKENDMIVCMYAAIKAGKVYVVLPSVYPENHIKHIIGDSKPDIILSPSVAGIKVEKIDTIKSEQITELTRIYAEYPAIDYKIKGDNTAFIMYTSGSSGMPKGVSTSFANIEYLVKHDDRTIAGLVDCSVERYREMLLGSYAFSISNVFFFNIGYLGGTCYSVPAETIRNPEKLLEYMKWVQPHGFVGTPSLINRMLEDLNFNDDYLSSLKVIVLGGEPFYISLAKKILDRFPNITLINAYGATETASAGITCKVTPEVLNLPGEIIPVSRKDSEISFIMDEDGKAIDRDNEYGELIIYGDMIVKGYHNNPEMTKDAFFELPDGTKAFKTGDMAYIEGDYIYLAGRKDNQVKIGGNRIEIEEVEARMNNCSIVKECAVAVKEDASGVKSLVAYAVLDSKEQENDQLSMFLKIKNEMMQNMEYYKIPQKIIFVESIPKTNNGKIDRVKLTEIN